LVCLSAWLRSFKPLQGKIEMNSFAANFIEQQPITQSLLQTIRLLGEYKGKQDLFKQQAPHPP
jgi:hypothetical protein